MNNVVSFEDFRKIRQIETTIKKLSDTLVEVDESTTILEYEEYKMKAAQLIRLNAKLKIAKLQRNK